MHLEKLLSFSECVGKLKTTKRSGWISQVGVTEPESVADHSFRCAVLAMCVGDLINVDTEKLIRMLLLHDIQEALTGDYNSYTKNEMGLDKVKLHERTAIEGILSLLPPNLRSRYISLWEEYEDQLTFEAILANDIDKIEMVMQALEYEEKGYDSEKLKAFWIKVQNEIQTPIVRDFFGLLRNSGRDDT